MKKAIFFDRDDTLIIDKNYMFQPKDLDFFPDTIEVLQKLQDLGYLLFIVTNQSGVGRGYFTLEQMHQFNQNMLDKLSEHNIKIQEIAYCPHTPNDGCDCRKPSPKLLNELITKYNIDRKQSYMVGDKQSDIEAGTNAMLASILIVNGDLKTKLKTEDLIK